MRIAILSTNPKAYGTRRLKKAAKDRGHDVRVKDTLSFSLYLHQKQPGVFLDGKSQKKIDAIIPRIGASVTGFGTAVVRQFEQMGIFTLNSASGILTARDKLRALQTLSRHDIGIPPSACVDRKVDIMPAIDEVGGAPVIIKVLQGTQGAGVILAETRTSAEAIIETLQLANQNVLIQKFISESRGKDIRAFVVGDKVVAAMRRTAQGEEFRSNVHRGGLTETVTLDARYTETAVRAAKIIGLNVAGVDLLESNDGPLVMEVNSSPGLEGIELATGIDVASKVIEYLEEQVIFPHLDVSERLSGSRGFSIIELAVPRTSPLAKKTIEEARLHERGVQVLCIVRAAVAIPNPGLTEKILPGDELVCFGEKLALKELVPGKTKRLLKK